LNKIVKPIFGFVKGRIDYSIRTQLRASDEYENQRETRKQKLIKTMQDMNDDKRDVVQRLKKYGLVDLGALGQVANLNYARAETNEGHDEVVRGIADLAGEDD